MGKDVWHLTMKISQLFTAVISKSMAAWLSTSVLAKKIIPEFYISWPHFRRSEFLPMISGC